MAQPSARDRYCALLAGGLLALWPCVGLAQRSGENAAALTDDAFGASVGSEVIGLYTETNVRGFNPQQAGNVRIDEVYVDLLSTLALRAKSSTTIRVGLAALDYPLPAPSGIVAHRARQPGNELRLSAELNIYKFGDPGGAIDMELPILRDRLSATAGIALGQPHFIDGARARNIAFAVVPLLRFRSLQIKPIVSGLVTPMAQVRPLVVGPGPIEPAMPEPGRYLGQTWARNSTASFVNGMLVRAAFTPDLRFRGGAFQSRVVRRKNFTEVFTVRGAQGLAGHRLVADPRQESYANSWDGAVFYTTGGERLRHTLMAQVRGRARHTETGGSQSFNYGDVILGVPDPQPQPAFAFNPLNVGRLRQTNYSLSYIGRMPGRGRVSLGVTKSRYQANFRAGPLVTRSSASPWLYDASLLITPGKNLAVYAAYVSGLEDSGIAPETADNRNEQLPPSQTSQVDAGVRVRVGRMNLVASAFQMKKPYFSIDAARRYTVLGDQRLRGVEVSAAGDLGDRLHVLAGAILMDPQVSGEGRRLGLVGPRPVNTPMLRARLDATYRTDILKGLTLTAAIIHDGSRAASAGIYPALGGRQLHLAPRTLVDLGVRHRFTVAGRPTSVRFVVNNVTNRKTWNIISSNTFQQDEPRRWGLFIVTDF